MKHHAALNTECLMIRRLEKMLLGNERQTAQFIEDGVPEIVAMGVMHANALLRKEVKSRMRGLVAFVKDEPVWEFVDSTLGIGPACIFFLGLLPPMEDFANPAKVWKYSGLDVRNGKSPKRERGTFAGYDAFLRAVAIARIGDPIIRAPESPYRRLYDNRKEFTRIAHPPIMPEGECEFCDLARGKTKAKRAESRQTRERTTLGFDCSNVGGIHWTDGHRHADARRYAVKAVVTDLWRVENGMEPRVGGQLRHDAHAIVVPALVAY